MYPILTYMYRDEYTYRFFWLFRAIGSGRFECLSVGALVALARRCGGEHIILRDVYGITFVFTFFSSSF